MHGRTPQKALDAIAGMKHPSIAEILRKRGFGYEASQIDELIAAWDEYIREAEQ